MEFPEDAIIEWTDDILDEVLATTMISSDEGEAVQDSIMRESNCVDANHEEKVSNTAVLEEASPLGLSLRKSQPSLDLIRRKFYQENRTVASNSKKMKVAKDDRKAVNFPAKLIRIGPWKMRSINKGDIVVKFYVAKEQLLWEILEEGLKKKIQFPWTKISAISAVYLCWNSDSLEVELNRPPRFFLESNPLSKGPSCWEPIEDFTDGSAPKYRRHYLEFDKGVLEKHFQKFLQKHPSLLALSRNAFCFDSPYFESNTSGVQQINLCNYPFAAKPSSDEPSTSTSSRLRNEVANCTPMSEIGTLPYLGSSIEANYQSSCAVQNEVANCTPMSEIGTLPYLGSSIEVNHQLSCVVQNEVASCTPMSEIGTLPYLGSSIEANHQLSCAVQNEVANWTPMLEIGTLPYLGSSIEANYQLSCSVRNEVANCTPILEIGTLPYLGSSIEANGQLFCAVRNEIANCTPMLEIGTLPYLVSSIEANCQLSCAVQNEVANCTPTPEIGTLPYLGSSIEANGQLFCAVRNEIANCTPMLEIETLPYLGSSIEANCQLSCAVQNEVANCTPTPEIGTLPYLGSSIEANYQLSCAVRNEVANYTPMSEIGTLPYLQSSIEDNYQLSCAVRNEVANTPMSEIGTLSYLGSSIEANYQLSSAEPAPQFMQVNPHIVQQTDWHQLMANHGCTYSPIDMTQLNDDLSNYLDELDNLLPEQ